MTKKEAKEILFRELEPIFKSRGYSKKKSKWHGFKREEANGFSWFYFDFYSYGDTQQLYFVSNKKNNAVEEIVKKVGQFFPMNPPLSDYTVTLFANYFILPKARQQEIGYSVMADNETAFVEVLQRIKLFFETEVFDTFDSFTDLRNIDRMINGEDFWATDYGKLYSFSDDFVMRRNIIAYLCNNPKLQEILNFNYREWYLKNNPGVELTTVAEPLRVNGQTSKEYLLEVLKSVKPLY